MGGGAGGGQSTNHINSERRCFKHDEIGRLLPGSDFDSEQVGRRHQNHQDAYEQTPPSWKRHSG